jgi:hypothetical protein
MCSQQFLTRLNCKTSVVTLLSNENKGPLSLHIRDQLTAIVSELMQQIMGSLQVVFCSDVRNHRKIVKWLNIPNCKSLSDSGSSK